MAPPGTVKFVYRAARSTAKAFGVLKGAGQPGHCPLLLWKSRVLGRVYDVLYIEGNGYLFESRLAHAFFTKETIWL